MDRQSPQRSREPVSGAGRERNNSELLGQTVVVLGDSAGIGLEIARGARAAGADVILTGEDPVRLERAALEVDVRSTAAFDARDQRALKRFFDGVPGPIDHIVISLREPARGPFAPAVGVARHSAGKMRPGGTLLLMGNIAPQLTQALAVAPAPVRIRVSHVAVGRVVDRVEVATRPARAMANTPVAGATDDNDNAPQLLAKVV